MLPCKVKDLFYLVLRFFRDNGRVFIDSLVVIFQNSLKFRKPSQTFQCHFLICNDTKYIAVSKYAVFSFLRYHPHFKVVIHCDTKTFHETRRFYRRYLKERISVIQDVEDGVYPFVAKGLLLIRIQGSSDFYLDADTRTNSTIPICDVPTALVAEFSFQDNPSYVLLLEKMNCDDKSNQYMLNVSFISWGGNSLHLSESEFLEWSDKYRNLNWREITSQDNIEFMQRFVEQVFFSLAFQRDKWNVLKANDQVADKGVIESTYYGASGYRFGR